MFGVTERLVKQRLAIANLIAPILTAYRNSAPIIMQWYATLGDMLDYKTDVRSKCRKCGVCIQVNVEIFAKGLGRDATLVNRIAQCPVVGCDGEKIFIASSVAAHPIGLS